MTTVKSESQCSASMLTGFSFIFNRQEITMCIIIFIQLSARSYIAGIPQTVDLLI